MLITAFTPQKKNPQRVNLHLDGRFALGLDLETLLEEKLEVGQEISEERFQKLVELSTQKKLWEKALKFLSFRPRSEKEVKNFLIKKKADEEEIGWALGKLKEKGYLNDEEFARWWVEQRKTFRPKGWRVLKMELRQKGVPEDTIAKLLNCYIAGGLEGELAKKVLEKKLESLKHLPLQKLKQKLGNHLARRGFDWEVIKKVVDGIY